MSNISGFNLGMSNYTNLLKQLNKDSKIKKELNTGNNNKVDKDEVKKLDLNNDGILTQNEVNTTLKKLKYSQTEQQTFWTNITGATIITKKTIQNSDGTQTVTQTKGAKTFNTVFDKNGDVISQTLTETNNKGTITNITYDSNGKYQQAIITHGSTQLTIDYADGKKVNGEKTVYNKDGTIKEKTLSFYNDNQESITYSKLTYQYDSNGKIKSTEQYVYDKDGKNEKIISKDTYKYQDDGDVASITTIAYKDGDSSKIAAKIENRYMANRDAIPNVTATENGLVINYGNNNTMTLNNGETGHLNGHTLTLKAKNQNNDDITIKYAQSGTISSYKVKGEKKNTKNTPDKYKIVSNTVTEKSNKLTKGNDDKPEQRKFTYSDGSTKIIDYKYNESGQKSSETEKLYDKNGKIIQSTVNLYKNDVIQSKVISNANGLNKKYEYNEQGNEIKCETLNSHGESRVITTTYTEDGKTKDTCQEEHYLANGFKKITRDFTYQNGKKVTEVRTGYNTETNNIIHKTNYKFDSNNNKVDEIIYYYNANNKISTVKYNGRYNNEVTNAVTVKFDDNGKIQSYTETDKLNTVEITYENGKIKSTTAGENYQLPNITTTNLENLKNDENVDAALEALDTIAVSSKLNSDSFANMFKTVTGYKDFDSDKVNTLFTTLLNDSDKKLTMKEFFDALGLKDNDTNQGYFQKIARANGKKNNAITAEDISLLILSYKLSPSHTLELAQYISNHNKVNDIAEKALKLNNIKQSNINYSAYKSNYISMINYIDVKRDNSAKLDKKWTKDERIEAGNYMMNDVIS